MSVGGENKDSQTVPRGIAVVEIGDELVNVNGDFTIRDKTIDYIVSTMLTEDEKREINTLIGSVLEQIKKDAAKTTVS